MSTDETVLARSRAHRAALEALLDVARRSVALVAPILEAGKMDSSDRLLAFLDTNEARLFAAAEAIGPALDDLYVARREYDRVQASTASQVN